MSRELKLVLQNLLDAVITPVGKVQIHSSQCPSDHFITICQVNCMLTWHIVISISAVWQEHPLLTATDWLSFIWPATSLHRCQFIHNAGNAVVHLINMVIWIVRWVNCNAGIRSSRWLVLSCISPFEIAIWSMDSWRFVTLDLLDAVITLVGIVQIHSSQCPSDHFITICQDNCMISIIKAYIKHTTAVKSTDSEEDRRAYSTACYQANNLINASHNQQCNQCISEPGSDSRRICSAVKDSLLSETTTDVGKCKQNAVFCSTLVAFCLLQPRKACVGWPPAPTFNAVSNVTTYAPSVSVSNLYHN